MNPLDGPRFKVERAKEQIEELYILLRSFMSGSPARIIPEDDVGEDEVSFLLKIAPMPSRAGPIVSDIVQNLRASLDYIVWELSILTNKNLWLDETAASRIEFPIFDDPGPYERGIGGKLKFVSAEARDVVESFQPYNRAKRPKNDLLLALYDLARFARHRELTPVVSGIRMTIKNLISGSGTFRWKCLGERDYRVVVAHSAIRRNDEHLDVEVAHDIAFGPGIGVEGPLPPVLAAIHDFISQDVIPAFAGFFPERSDLGGHNEPTQPHVIKLDTAP